MTRTLSPEIACDILRRCAVPIGADFHALKFDAIAALLLEADRLAYRAPAGANGSRGRCFHDRLQRLAARAPAGAGKAEIAASLHRFHDLAALHTAGGLTVYLSAGAARRLADALEACAHSIESSAFARSHFGTTEIADGADVTFSGRYVAPIGRAGAA